MSTFEFGLVVGMDKTPDLRLLVLAPAADEGGRRWYRETWRALVLADLDGPDAYGWEVGTVVTLSPAASGLVVFGNAMEE